MAGVQCLKRLYFQVYRPELAHQVEEGVTARLRQGNEVGLLTQAAFNGGVLVGFDGGIDEALATTAVLLDDPSVRVIFESTFRYSNVLVRVDVLQRRRGGRWRLIEVKSAVAPKKHYLDELAIQHHVLTKCGLDISSVCLMLLNREYRYDGRQHRAGELFKMVECLPELEKRGSTDLTTLLQAQYAVLAGPEPPDVQPGDHCSSPYRCEFYGHCNEAPVENVVSLLPRVSPKKLLALTELGVSVIQDIPEDFQLTETQARIWTALKTGETWVGDSLREELAGIEYPRYFMDFESLYPAIPRFQGMWPYSQIPFQWSVHRQRNAWAELEHLEFLGNDELDPRLPFIESLLEAVEERGPIVVYNASFESTRLKELAERIPEYREQIERLQARLWDLLPCVRRNVYHPKFGGSYSIKAVLPALVPEMTYDGMEVAHGAQAGLAWEQMVRGGVDAVARRRLRDALLAYCRQDTLAMVRILERLGELATTRTRTAS